MISIFKELEQIYCLEVPKGVRQNLLFVNGDIQLFPGEGYEVLFDLVGLKEKLASFGIATICICGIINGPILSFTVYDVKLNKDWISVPLAREMAKFLKFDFVKYSITTPKEAEFQTGVILKPIQECVDEDGNRIIEEIK